MPVKIRLTRTGAKKEPSYRVVVMDSRSPRDGRYIELIGRYDPRPEPSLVEIDTDKAKSWLAKGAQPSEPVVKLLEIAGVLEPRPEKPKKAKPAAKTEAKAEKAEEPKAEAEEPKAEAAEAKAEAAEAKAEKAEAAEEPKAEAVEEPKAETAEEPKVEAVEEAATEGEAEAGEETEPEEKS
ncbi:MAG: 30S ribosomal protein S16 [Actinobacteria bacterium]|nr:MAG: 30S ribosomal protein S16 [Actinomycetota bacterium]